MLGGATAVGLSLPVAARLFRKREHGLRADVFIAPADYTAATLAPQISAGLRALGFERPRVAGKRVLLKPNLVETALDRPFINTHPSVVLAVAEAFLRLDAARVVVGEGQGHRRDSELVLHESGMGEALRQAQLEFVDLNHDQVVTVANAGRWTRLPSLHLPRTLLAADIVVSLPKLKTHHWAGLTCSMKNLFGVMPGIAYGWPKNVLHWHGIHESVLDINATVKPHLAIVDAVIGMEGDGPIMGAPKPVGCVVMGANLPAVDATCARLMKLRPEAINYLASASGTLGPVLEPHIRQVGAPISRFATPFALLDAPHLAGIRAG